MMREVEWTQVVDDYPSCNNCFNCKTKNEKVFCKLGFFSQNKNKLLIFTPYDFDCDSYDP